MYVNTK